MKNSKNFAATLAVLSASFQQANPGMSVRNEAFDPEKALGAINETLVKVTDKLKTHAENAQANTDLTAETKASVDNLMILKNSLAETQKEILARLEGAEQKLAMPANVAPSKILSLGEQIVIAPEFLAAFPSGESVDGKINYNAKVKQTLNAITGDTGSGGALVDPQRLGVVVGPSRALAIRDLINWGRTNSNLVEFPKESTFTNNADVVSENPAAGKPQSEIDYTLESEKVATIAHYIKASKQVLSDAPMLQSLIDSRLRYGVDEKLEDQLMKGSGTGQEINGIFTQATAYSQPGGTFVQAETRLDRLRLALLQVELADYMADSITINPTDWANIELTKNSQNSYLFANPFGMTAPMLWGKPVVSTKSLDADEFLVGAFQTAVNGWVREDVMISMTNSDQDDFTKNMITILGEMRAALTVYQDAAFVKGSFDGLNGSV
jgi:HK97 family phage major capsid protein